ncbi:MAG: hypothetical protein ACO3CQ_06410 [Candidatus Nanopelagicaceae bacterium]
MTKPIGYRGYKLNPNKLKKAPQGILPYVVGAFYYTEDFEYFNIIKPYLDIPEPPKSLEEISQELDEKFEKLIEKTHLEYRIGHNWLYKKKKYEEFCKKQDEDFEYAKEHGQFPEKLKWGIGTALSANSNSFVSHTYVIKQGNNHEGYYTFGTGFVRFYMTTKPNTITRWFMDKCLSFRWVDEK